MTVDYHSLSYFIANPLNLALSIGVTLLLLDAVFQKISNLRFLTAVKFLGCLCIGLTIWIAGINFSGVNSYLFSLLVVVLPACAYAGLRLTDFKNPVSADIFAASALVLALSASLMGIAANLLMLVIGVIFIVWGSKTLNIPQLNIGMVSLVLLVGTRFFDSSLSLLIRGIVFILLGIAFLGINIVISKKRKELRS